jgi:hypothetical protein
LPLGKKRKGRGPSRHHACVMPLRGVWFEAQQQNLFLLCRLERSRLDAVLIY